MAKIKVLHLIESLELGGAQWRLVNDLRYADKSRFEHRVCSLFKNDALRRKIEQFGISVYTADLDGQRDIIKGFFRVRSLIRDFAPDILHTQLFWADVLGRAAAGLCKAPLVVSTIQSSVYEPGNKYLYSRKRKLLDVLTGRLSGCRYIAVSEFVKESAIKRLGIRPERIEVIYNSVDFEEYGCADGDAVLSGVKKNLGLEGAWPVLSTVGRLNPPKGHVYLLEAVAAVKSRFPGIKLLVIGEGPSLGELKELAVRLNIEEQVLFLGLRGDVKGLLAASDIFVFPTLSEGLPIALLEAMALGKPCIVSDIGPNIEVVNSDMLGYVFGAGNSRHLASVIEEACGDKELLRAKGIAAMDSARERFSAELIAGKLPDYYQSIYSKKEKARR